MIDRILGNKDVCPVIFRFTAPFSKVLVKRKIVRLPLGACFVVSELAVAVGHAQKETVAYARASGKDKGNGWVDYKFKNPTSNKVEHKTAYILRSGDIFVMTGIYK